MRICLVVPRIKGVGGIAVVVRQLREELIRRRCVLSVLTGPPLKVKGLMNPSFAVKASWLIKKMEADVFHAHGGFSMIPLSKAEGKKVLTLHGVWHKAVRFLHGKTAGWIAKGIESRCLKKFDAVTVVSREAERVYREWNPIYIPNGIDVSEFGRKAKNPVDLPPSSVLYVGRLSREKGIEVLLEAWRKIRRSQRYAQLYILGSGKLQGKVLDYQKFGVHLVGLVPHGEIPNWLSNASLFVLPSVRETGTPMAVLEAMAMKIPVVATRTGGVPDVVIQGQTGILVKPNSVDQLAENVIKALTRDLNSMAMKAYQRIKENHNLREILGRYVELYESML